MSGTRLAWFAGAGLFAGAAAWALHQQAGYIIASWACTRAAPEIWFSGGLAIVLILAGVALSALGWRRSRAALSPEAARPRRFLGLIGLVGTALFLFAVILQMAAAVFLPGCVG